MYEKSRNEKKTGNERGVGKRESFGETNKKLLQLSPICFASPCKEALKYSVINVENPISEMTKHENKAET